MLLDGRRVAANLLIQQVRSTTTEHVILVVLSEATERQRHIVENRGEDS